MGFSSDFWRCIVASLLGGVYGSFCLLRGFQFLGGFIWRCLFLILISVVAFGWNRSTAKRGGVFLLLNMALGGVVESIGNMRFSLLIITTCLILFFSHFLFSDAVGSREYVPLTIIYGDKSVRLTALRDTGNTLRDPFSGEQVYLISAGAAFRLTGLSQEQLRCPMETLAQHPLSGLRLIPYRAIGNEGGMLLAMRFEHVQVGSVSCSAVIAFAAEGLGEGQCYQALVT